MSIRVLTWEFKQQSLTDVFFCARVCIQTCSAGGVVVIRGAVSIIIWLQDSMPAVDSELVVAIQTVAQDCVNKQSTYFFISENGLNDTVIDKSIT